MNDIWKYYVQHVKRFSKLLPVKSMDYRKTGLLRKIKNKQVTYLFPAGLSNERIEHRYMTCTVNSDHRYILSKSHVIYFCGKCQFYGYIKKKREIWLPVRHFKYLDYVHCLCEYWIGFNLFALLLLQISISLLKHRTLYWKNRTFIIRIIRLFIDGAAHFIAFELCINSYDSKNSKSIKYICSIDKYPFS